MFWKEKRYAFQKQGERKKKTAFSEKLNYNFFFFSYEEDCTNKTAHFFQVGVHGIRIEFINEKGSKRITTYSLDGKGARKSLLYFIFIPSGEEFEQIK